MKITKHIHFAINLTHARVSMLDTKGGAWDHLFFIGRALEPDQPGLRAFQVHLLWLNFSAWKTNCAPLTHELHHSISPMDSTQ